LNQLKLKTDHLGKNIYTKRLFEVRSLELKKFLVHGVKGGDHVLRHLQLAQVVGADLLLGADQQLGQVLTRQQRLPVLLPPANTVDPLLITFRAGLWLIRPRF